MTIITTCAACRSRITTSTSAATRLQLALTRGKELTLKCQNCNTTAAYHVDDFRALPSRFPLILASVIFIVGILVSFLLLQDYLFRINNHYSLLVVSGFFLVPITIYTILNRQVTTRAAGFNRVRVKGRQSNINF